MLGTLFLLSVPKACFFANRWPFLFLKTKLDLAGKRSLARIPKLHSVKFRLPQKRTKERKTAKFL